MNTVSLKLVKQNKPPYKKYLQGIFTLLCCIGAVEVDCQAVFDKTVDFLPPPPNASAMIQYGNATVSKNTGAPSISIPIYTVKGIKLSTSVSLGYSSTGIKVDEIASRVGMGWSLNAGGVITRTVRGKVDEDSQREYPNLDSLLVPTWTTVAYAYRVLSPTSPSDAEPDLYNFSFDGYNGSFVTDGAGNCVQVGKSGLKITPYHLGNDWNFKITTPDGIIYVFGGSDAVEKTKRTTSCGKPFGEYIPTSWYVKEIQYTNGEILSFNYEPIDYSYDNGVSETLVPEHNNLGCVTAGTSKCANKTSVEGRLLRQIFTLNRRLTFTYISREDCTDKLLSNIKYTYTSNNSSLAFGSFDFAYSTVISSSAYTNDYPSYYGTNKTPYLISITENSADTTLHKTHYFSYDKPQDRPPRLSYSQDHWGYFNGQNNTTLLPYFPGFVNASAATANREPEFAYCGKGLLQKIVYPTGGINMLFYEPNKFNESYSDDYNTQHSLSTSITGTGNSGEVSNSVFFHTDVITQRVSVLIDCSGVNPSGQERGTVSIVNADTDDVIWSQLCGAVEFYNVSVELGPGNYYLRVMAVGQSMLTSSTIKFYPHKYSIQHTEKIVGGARIAKIITTNPGETPMVKKYFYGTYDNLNTSSLAFIWDKPEYVGYVICMNPGVPSAPESPGYPGAVWRGDVMYSNSIINLGFYNGSCISYGSVVESNGENFEGGGTESQFYTENDSRATVIFNQYVLSAPYSNYSSRFNARPRSETILKKMADGELRPIKKTEYSYYLESGQIDIPGYVISVAGLNLGGANFSFDTLCYSLGCLQYRNLVLYGRPELYGYAGIHIGRYITFSNWGHPEYTTETIYDENGENPVTSTTYTFFENPLNFQLTKTETVNSKGQTTRTINKYVHDFISEPVYAEMVDKNIINPLINSKTEIDDIDPMTPTPLTEQQVNYEKIWANYLPVSFQKSIKGNLPLDIEGTIDRYDGYGNISQFTGKNGITTAVIWGYENSSPIAQIVGDTYEHAYAELTVIPSSLEELSEEQQRTELNKIRTGLPDARITTYTYKRNIGVSSITDPNNKTNKYEYDSFGRLIYVIDQDGNIVKKNEYSYTTPDSNTTVPIYYNAALTREYHCTTCEPGYESLPINYTVPAGRYYSLNSQGDANSKAVDDTTINGQVFANRNSLCVAIGSPTWCNNMEGYEFINGYCQQGTKVYDYCSAVNSNGTWTAYYHYLFTDNSTSLDYNELMPACTGNDKRKVGCVCETGEKVCVPPTNNAGNYSVTYHYHWSDDHNSPNYTENFTCNGVDKKIIGCGCETAIKHYLTSEICTGVDTPYSGCNPGTWKCTYEYKWSDNTTSSSTYTEFSSTNCIPPAP